MIKLRKREAIEASLKRLREHEYRGIAADFVYCEQAGVFIAHADVPLFETILAAGTTERQVLKNLHQEIDLWAYEWDYCC